MALIRTLVGDVEESQLIKKEIVTGEDEYSACMATEWYLNDQMVRRDVHVTLKKLPDIFGHMENS